MSSKQKMSTSPNFNELYKIFFSDLFFFPENRNLQNPEGISDRKTERSVPAGVCIFYFCVRPEEMILTFQLTERVGGSWKKIINLILIIIFRKASTLKP